MLRAPSRLRPAGACQQHRLVWLCFRGLDGGDPGPPGDLKAHLLLRVLPVQSEDKVKAIANLYGPLMALNHMVQQDYFPKALAPLLQAFMTK